VDLDTGSKSKVWRVYERRKKGVKSSAAMETDVTESIKE